MEFLFKNRKAKVAQILTAGKAFSPDIQNSITKMTLYPDRHWRVKDLARLSGLSESHFYRRFRQVTGSSPIDWLRQERINHARQRLLHSNDPIRQDAEQVGY